MQNFKELITKMYTKNQNLQRCLSFMK